MNRVAVLSLCLLFAIGFVTAGCTGSVANPPPPVMPTITTQPANQTVTAGQTASFMVVATGTAPLSYQWQKDGTAISGATSASYTTAATSSSDNGAKFQVVVSDSAGSVTSNAATLTVNAAATAPSITTQPVNQTVTVGQTASFTVVATGTAPLAYQWQKNGTAIGGATSASYTTPTTTSADNGAKFVVVVSNSAGSVPSNAATLTVNASTGAPSITTQPANQTVTVGRTASFTVVATGTAPLAYQWQKNGAAISGATSASYTTPATTSADNGAQFVVVVSNSAGSVTSNAATLMVNATATAPTITIQPANQTVTVGRTAMFTVAATGTAPLSYQWQKNGTAINGATSASYTTPATTSADNGAQFVVMVSNVAGNVTSNAATLTVNAAGSGAIKTVFLILEENHNWSAFKGSTSAPYINNTLLTTFAHAEQYYNPPGLHPSEPNYLWLEAGTNFGITDDSDPSSNHQSTTNHLVTFLKNANISWKTYQEDISGTSCPLTSVANYAPKHNPFVFFDDVTNTNDPASAYCIAHVRPFTELAADLTNNTVASYNFITPNLCDDGHDSCSPLSDPVAQTDTWLSQNLPVIMNSAAYKAGGVAIFITWDEGEGGDGPIGLLAISPNAKPGYSNTIHYDHSSTLRTIEEIFNVTPLLGGAASATDLSDLFVSFP